jgi:hypothetical protein
VASPAGRQDRGHQVACSIRSDPFSSTYARRDVGWRSRSIVRTDAAARDEAEPVGGFVRPEPYAIDFQNSSVFKLKQAADYADKVSELLLPGEEILDAYKSMRDGVVLTTKRIIVVNVQGLTGKKKDYTSIPYSKIQAYSVETAGAFDLDSELEVYISSIGQLRFEFATNSKVVEISKYISQGIL